MNQIIRQAIAIGMGFAAVTTDANAIRRSAQPGLFGFPLHPAGKPSIERSIHLEDVRVPMLLLQGTRDALAEFGVVEDVVGRLSGAGTLVAIDDGDHSFHVPAKSGRNDSQVLDGMLDGTATWMRRHIGRT